MRNNPDVNEECMICGSEVVFDGYNDDWAVLKCSKADCSYEIERPASNPNADGFTMESLEYVSKYVDD